MTRVTLFHGQDGALCGFECRGHSGYAAAGSDIVCAAVSALSITCCNALQSVAGVKPDLREGDGLLTVRLSLADQTHDAQVILRTFEQGIQDIAASYPKHIVFTTR